MQRNWYDGDGKRIKKVEASQTTIYIYQGWNIIYEKESSTMTETKYIFGPNGHVAKIVGNTKYYYHSDHLGSLKQETDDSGNALWSSPAQYDPFGEMRSGGAEKDGYFYTGKLRDTSTGLYYYGARFYDPKIGRFLTKDTMTGSALNSQTMNLYIYTLNNPLKYVDPTGNWVGAYETYTTTRSGRVVGITGAGGYHDVSSLGLKMTENGIVRMQPVTPPPTPAPAFRPVPATPISARTRAYMNRELKYGAGPIDVINSTSQMSQCSAKRDIAYDHRFMMFGASLVPLDAYGHAVGEAMMWAAADSEMYVMGGVVTVLTPGVTGYTAATICGYSTEQAVYIGIMCTVFGLLGFAVGSLLGGPVGGVCGAAAGAFIGGEIAIYLLDHPEIGESLMGG